MKRIAAAELAKTDCPRIQEGNGQHVPAQREDDPIGMPATEALYPPVVTADGKPMNAQHDYVIRMSKQELPPVKAFWSVTLYDLQNGFFIPNDRKKYSVGENAGMKLNKDGGIAIYIAADKPKGVPEENWLLINP